ncbi:MAG: YIP1 family protein [Clostridia bacterium]|nr:YIP1 family protein [Clostridia bacterium]
MVTVLKQLKYAFTLMFHPFDGFWDLKHEKRGSLTAALIIVGLLCVQQIFKTQFTGFIYNPEYDGVSLNVLKEIAIVLGTFLLWCVANWSLTTLMNGEGSFKDIVMASAYAMAPFFIIGFPLIFLSNIMSEDYESFYYLLLYISIGWSALLMVSSVLVIHQYTLGKTILTTVFIVVAMAVIIFLLLLFFNLISQMVGFITGLYWEISLRFF